MSLTAGARIGAYEIAAPLGQGGMGEVWRARDTRLGRDVAIKAIPEALAHDAERVARFEREARLLASLNHPNIGGIHGLEEAGGHRYLILEFIDGETLAQRLRRGALPIREAVTVCRAVAGALEAAHESGVIHRDLKPGNVMVRADGEVKVLDFGLAKSGTAAGSGSELQLSASPTITHYAGSAAGVILGTAAYMSPEQARGKAVDRRTDIWSFGCLLYECLSGRQAFEGETVSDVIARILEREPDWSALPPATSPGVRELLQRCLDKDAKQRLRDIGDARLALERELSGATSRIEAATAGAAPAARPRSSLFATLGWIAAIVVAAVFAAALASRNSGGPGRATHLSVALPEDLVINDGDWSRDGQTIVWIARPKSDASLGNEAQRIYVRRFDDFALKELPGTAGATAVAISKDNRSAIFRGPLAPGSNDTRLARVPLDGSVPPVTITAWNPDWNSFEELESREIVALNRAGDRLFRFGANGGSVRETKIDRGDLRATVRLDGAIPGDRGLLVTGGVYRESGWATETGVIDLKSNRLKMLGVNGGNSNVLRDGILLYSLGQILFAVKFDLGKLAIEGTPVAVATGLRADFSYTAGDYIVSDGGDLLFVPGGEAGNQRRLGLMDPAGKLTVLPFEPRPYQGWPSVARHGGAFCVRVTNGQGIDEIWAGELGQAALRRVTTWPRADCVNAVIAPDGRHVAYGRVGRDNEDGLYIVDLEGGGVGRRLIVPDSTGVDVRPEAWSPDGRWIIHQRSTGSGAGNLWVAQLSASRDSVLSDTPLRVTADSEDAVDFSPDGGSIAFISDETGRNEVYVAPFTEGKLGRTIRITTEGGWVPEWLPGGREISYRDLGNRHFYVIAARPGATPREWGDFEALGGNDNGTTHDGNEMLVLRGPNERGGRALNLIFRWVPEMKKKLAGKR